MLLTFYFFGKHFFLLWSYIGQILLKSTILDIFQQPRGRCFKKCQRFLRLSTNWPNNPKKTLIDFFCSPSDLSVSVVHPLQNFSKNFYYKAAYVLRLFAKMSIAKPQFSPHLHLHLHLQPTPSGTSQIKPHVSWTPTLAQQNLTQWRIRNKDNLENKDSLKYETQHQIWGRTQTNQTKPTKPNLPKQGYWTKPTKP